MFTGIIQDTGIVTRIEEAGNCKKFGIKPKKLKLSNKKIGDSISINGVCVTITKITKKDFEFDAITETLEKTNLKQLKKTTVVNIESSIKVNQAIEGHIVQGHIDKTAEVNSLTKKDKRTILQINIPEGLHKYMALKGSIAINGVSLTISDLRTETFSVDLIPHTLKETNLSKLKKGDIVNIEIDIIARYLERLLEAKADETKYEFLKERGFI